MTALRILGRIFLVLFTIILAVLVLAVGLVYIFEQGPSPALRDIFVQTVDQTSAAKFAARMFLDDETVDSILNPPQTSDVETAVTDTTLVGEENQAEDFDINAITVEDIKGGTYRGKVMIVNDPSRVYVYSIPAYTDEGKGMQVQKMCKAEDAAAGVNGGGFVDVNGMGQGGRPRGVVISRGKWLNGDLGGGHCVIGFDQNDKLIVGTMSGQQAKDLNLRDAVEWGPALIVNGEALDPGTAAGGLNPRTAIGQRADGAVILVVVEGRQPGSMGASYQDLIDIMMRYGAVNAGNLDGGTSSSMIYNDELITNVCSLYGERTIPTAVLVEKR